MSDLRPSNIDGAKHAGAILILRVRRLRQVWPPVKIIFRGDGGFCRRRILSWCESHDVDYVVGTAKDNRLLDKAGHLIRGAKERFEDTQHKQRRFGWVGYAAQTWTRSRRIIVKAEHTEQGSNPRFVVTTLDGDPQDLYDRLYCARGERENRIKEQFQLFSDRTSCHRWWPNQFRLLLASCAYVLVETIRSIGLKHTRLAQAQVNTIREKPQKP